MEDFLRSQWDSTSVRHSFIRKVKVSPLHVPVRLFCECFVSFVSFRKHICVFSRVFGQVYLILTAQLAVTISVVAVFTFV